MTRSRQARSLSPTDQARLRLLQVLAARGYRFVTPTDATHRNVFSRSSIAARADLRDVFGWNRVFSPDHLDPEIIDLMRRGRMIRRVATGLRSTLRVSSLGDLLLLHSGFPTTGKNAVFFGPDTYRFARFLRSHVPQSVDEGLLVDIGAGSGAGGLLAAGLAPRSSLVLTDINSRALGLARLNALHAGVDARLVLTAGLEGIDGPIALAIANPPYIAGRPGHAYQDGGDLHGAAVSLDWARQAMAKLKRGGRMLLYTGTAIIRGEDPLKVRLTEAAHALACDLLYEEIDPDIFGEELRRPAYAEVDRIAAVTAVITHR